MRLLALCASLLIALLSSGCMLAPEDGPITFTFPDASQGDSEGADGVWRGTRSYTGKYGAKITYDATDRACVGLIQAVQNADFIPIPGTEIPVSGSGILKLSAQGPCKATYAVTVVPAD